MGKTEARLQLEQICKSYGLSVHEVGWDDCGRDFMSSTGSNITDSTLVVDGMKVPIIRYGNFKDMVCYKSLKEFKVVVGNEREERMKHEIPLEDYLGDMESYTTAARPEKDAVSFLVDRDEDKAEEPCLEDQEVIVSCQACLIPCKKGEKMHFKVNLKNYQSTAKQPAVLCIVATEAGTSAQLLHGKDQTVGFNAEGFHAPFEFQRSSDFKAELKEDDPNITMEEVDAKMEACHSIKIIQVPLKHSSPRFGSYSYSCIPETSFMGESSFGAGPSFGISIRAKGGCTAESGVVRTGKKTDKPFVEFGEFSTVRRDDNLPIRITILHYYGYDNEDMFESTAAKQLVKQIHEDVSRYVGNPKEKDVGSTVTDPDFHQKKTKNKVPFQFVKTVKPFKFLPKVQSKHVEKHTPGEPLEVRLPTTTIRKKTRKKLRIPKWWAPFWGENRADLHRFTKSEALLNLAYYFTEEQMYDESQTIAHLAKPYLLSLE